MNRSAPAVLAAVSLVPPVALPLVAAASAAGPTATTAAGTLYIGPAAKMRWGPVRVRIRVSGGRITNVGATAPTERPRSARINGHALPILKAEVLRAQSARINTVGGATLTTKAYESSLQSAIAKAHL